MSTVYLLLSPMPKSPNLSNPVAAIRHRMGMRIDDFAQFIGHGAAMLKQVESGHRPMGRELMKKIHDATGVAMSLLEKGKWTDAERNEFLYISPAPLGRGPDLNEPLRLLPEILATYLALSIEGKNPALGLVALRRETLDTLKRWNVDSGLFSAIRADILGLLFAQPKDRKQLPPSAELLKCLDHAEGFKTAKLAAAKRAAALSNAFRRKGGYKATLNEVAHQLSLAQTKAPTPGTA